MREAVLNSACIDGTLASLEDAASKVVGIEKGLSLLLKDRLVVTAMRLHASVHEIQLTPTSTLFDVLKALMVRGTDSGRLFVRMATKYPVEDDLQDHELSALVDWIIPAYPQCLCLLLCVASGRMSVSITNDSRWEVDLLNLEVAKDPANPSTLEGVAIDNLYSEESAFLIKDRLHAAQLFTIEPQVFWGQRTQFVPNLDFAPRVEHDLSNLPAETLSSTLERLLELDTAAANWEAGMPSPDYLSKVTGESESTMNKYGSSREFRSSDGSKYTFEKHARLPNGFRLHLRELPSTRRIEIGYVGPHLPTVSFPN